MRVFCDFDGTISSVDTTDLVLRALADPAWEAIEEAWLAGEITAAECMRRQVALIGGDEAALEAVLDSVQLTPGFIEFAAWCQAKDVPLVIVSDGVDAFIKRILARAGVTRLRVIANHLVGEAGARGLEQPWRREGCAAGSGVCKCAVVNVEPAPEGPMVFLGDGRSDFCVSGRADILFAKSKLADYAAARGQAFTPFDDFFEVIAHLEPVRETARQAPARRL